MLNVLWILPAMLAAPVAAHASLPHAAALSCGHCQPPTIGFSEDFAASDREIALTFDDGPDGARGMTDKVIDQLQTLGVPATFFICGDVWAHVASDESAKRSIRRMAAAGFGIANHTTHHKHLPSLDATGVEQELAETEAIVHRSDVLGPNYPPLTLLRAPYGQPFEADPVNARWIGPIFGHFGVHVGWNINSYDWACTTPACVERNVLRAVDAGITGTVLMHSNYQVTVDALPTIVRTLKEKGYRFVTVEKLVMDKYGASSRELHNNFVEQCEMHSPVNR